MAVHSEKFYRLTLTWDVLKLKANKNMILQLTWLTLTWDVLKFVIIA